MTEPRLNHVHCLDGRGLHRMAYWEWGDAANPRVLVCVHGLSRQGRDFDTLARAMLPRTASCAPTSSGAATPTGSPTRWAMSCRTYVADMVTLLARLDARTVDWVGTSMGGLIGLGLAALPGSPVRRLVLNDVGPGDRGAGARAHRHLPRPADAVRQTLDEAADDLRAISHRLRPAHARAMAGADPADAAADGDGLRAALRPGHRGAVPRHHARDRRGRRGGVVASYDALRCPTLLLRGADSDLLSHDTAQAMTQRGPNARLVEFAGVGHAPMLVAAEQIDVVREFLLSP